jgi:hypothetical protein
MISLSGKCGKTYPGEKFLFNLNQLPNESNLEVMISERYAYISREEKVNNKGFVLI